MPWPKPKRSERTQKGGESLAQTNYNHLDPSPTTPNETKRSRFLGILGSRSTSRSPSPRPPSSALPRPSRGQDPNAHRHAQQQVAPYPSVMRGGSKGLWDKAYDELPDELKQHLVVDKLQTLKNVLGAAIDAKEANITKRLKLKWGDKEIDVQETADRLVGWVTKFKEIGDIAVQYDPVHAALPWAGVRFILLVSSTVFTIVID